MSNPMHTAPKKILLLLSFFICFFKSHSQNSRLDSMLSVYHSDSLNVSASLLNAIGGAYYIQYDNDGYNKALKFYQMALDIAKHHNDQKLISTGYRLIASVYDAINMELDTAAVYYENYLNYQLSVNDTARIIDGYRNLLVINFKLKKDQIEVADKLYTFLKASSKHSNANFKNQLCIFYSQKKLLARAKELFTEIDVDKVVIFDSESFRNYYYAKHYLLRAQKKGNEAIPFLESMLNKAKLTVDSISLTQFLSEHYQKTGDYKNAVRTLELYVDLLTKYINEDSRNKIAETASFYLNKEKEKERIYLKDKMNSETKIKNYSLLLVFLFACITLLITFFLRKTRRQNHDLKENKEELIKLNEEKTLYLKEIHHRVKNNLQVISSMLDLQMQDTKDEKTKFAFSEMQTRVYSIGIAHKTLYERENLNQIDLNFYFESLFETIYNVNRHAGKVISFHPATNNISFNIDYVIPLGLIVNELITNSLKHAFINKTEGAISITITEKGKNSFEFRYLDNGQGFAENINMDTTKSFGLKFIKLMVKKLKGKLNFMNTLDGVIFDFTFTIQE